MRFYFSVFALVLVGSPSFAQETSSVRYLANEGVLVTHNDTSILIDPLFQNSYGTYQMVPDDVRNAMFAGEGEFAGVDAVFVSHHHGDHFSAVDILRLLRSQTNTKLYAPAQAVAAMREISTPDDESSFDRITGLDLEYGDSPVQIETANLLIEAAYIPHSGWPTARTEIQNISFRITLADKSTVLHMGDADARIVHFEADEEYWEERVTDIALPPYWFFASDDGVEILEDRMDVRYAIGIHAPAEFSNRTSIPDKYIGTELFTQPGEGRKFVGSQ